MYRSLFLFLAVAGGLFAPVGRAQASDATTVTLALESGHLAHDFGETTRRQRLTRTLTLRNTGDTPIEIGDVKHTCGGCSPVRLSGRRIGPGGAVKAVLRFDSGKNTGRQVRDVYIPVEQGGNSGILTFRTVWEIRAYLGYKPEEVRTGEIPWGQGYGGRVTLITADLEKPVRVLASRCDWKWLSRAEALHRGRVSFRGCRGG